jgi:hypothetical protein
MRATPETKDAATKRIKVFWFFSSEKNSFLPYPFGQFASLQSPLAFWHGCKPCSPAPPAA